MGKFIQLSSTFFGGFVIAFIKGWKLALVLLSSLPPLVLTSSAMIMVMAKLASRAQTAYSAAAVVVERTLTSIRTVRKLLCLLYCDDIYIYMYIMFMKLGCVI